MKPQLSAQGGDRRLSDSSEKGELDGLFFSNFLIWAQNHLSTFSLKCFFCRYHLWEKNRYAFTFFSKLKGFPIIHMKFLH